MAFIEEHSKADPAPSWVNEMSLYNIYENERIGNYFEEHNIDTKWNAPKPTEDRCLDARCWIKSVQASTTSIRLWTPTCETSRSGRIPVGHAE
jgi:hypothetical protein